MQGFSFSLLHIPAVSFIGCIKLWTLKFTETRLHIYTELSLYIGGALLIKKTYIIPIDRVSFSLFFLFLGKLRNVNAISNRIAI